MKIFILRPKDGLPDDDNPWKPWYGKSFGFIVRAKNEEEARRFADSKAGDENREAKPWLDAKYSSCEELKVKGDIGIVMRDYRSA